MVQLATSLQFVVSLAQDDHMCVWERTRTRLLHKISTVSEKARKSVDKESGLGEKEKWKKHRHGKYYPFLQRLRYTRCFFLTVAN